MSRLSHRSDVYFPTNQLPKLQRTVPLIAISTYLLIINMYDYVELEVDMVTFTTSVVEALLRFSAEYGRCL